MPGRGLLRYYGCVAVVFTNVLLLIIGLNVLAWVILEAGQWKKKESTTPYKFRGYDQSLQAVYPGYTDEQIDKICKDTRRLHMQYEPFLQHKEAPFQSEFINVDARGFRNTKNQAAFPPDKSEVNIFLFGGSTTFGYGVSDQDTIASHLQDYLRRTMGLPVNVYNFGRAHYTSMQEKMLFEQLLLAGHVPTIAIFMDGLNEFVHYRGNPAFTNVLKSFMLYGDVPPERKILLRMPVVKLLMPNLAHQISLWDESQDASRGTVNRPDQAILSQAVDRYLANKSRIESLANDFGVSTLFVWQPVPVYGYNMEYHVFAGYDYESTYPQVKAGYAVAAGRLEHANLGSNFLWAADIQAGLKEPLYVSAFHYSSKMSARISELIGSQLKARMSVASVF